MVTLYVTCRHPSGWRWKRGMEAERCDVPVAAEDRSSAEVLRALRDARTVFASRYSVPIEEVEVLGSF